MIINIHHDNNRRLTISFEKLVISTIVIGSQPVCNSLQDTHTNTHSKHTQTWEDHGVSPKHKIWHYTIKDMCQYLLLVSVSDISAIAQRHMLQLLVVQHKHFMSICTHLHEPTPIHPTHR